MVRLRRRRPLDALASDRRRHRRRGLTRWIYIAALTAGAGWAADALLGEAFYLKADGLVASRPYAVATEYTATVRSIAVDEGARVARGDALIVVSSQEVVERLSDHALRLAASRSRLADFRIRAELARELLAAAEKRRKTDMLAAENLESLHRRGLIAVSRYADAVREAYRSFADEETLRAELRTTEGEVAELTLAVANSQQGHDKLLEVYAAGVLRAPVDGIVTGILVSEGGVVRAGEPLIEIQGGMPRVLAYVPTTRLYRLRVGERVRIRCGLNDLPGEVRAISPFAARLPVEFQHRLRPVERAVMIEVTFDAPETAPPIFTTVRLSKTSGTLRWYVDLLDRLVAVPCGAQPPRPLATDPAMPVG